MKIVPSVFTVTGRFGQRILLMNTCIIVLASYSLNKSLACPLCSAHVDVSFFAKAQLQNEDLLLNATKSLHASSYIAAAIKFRIDSTFRDNILLLEAFSRHDVVLAELLIKNGATVNGPLMTSMFHRCKDSRNADLVRLFLSDCLDLTDIEFH